LSRPSRTNVEADLTRINPYNSGRGAGWLAGRMTMVYAT